MYVACMAFHARVSDPLIGGTYMTLLNTVTNLGGNWPSTVALWMVDPLTSKECRGALGQSCSSAAAAEVSRRPANSCLAGPPGVTVPPLLAPAAVRQGGRRLRDNAGRLLRGVGGVCADWSAVVGVAGQEDERAAGEEPRGVEVPSGPLTVSHLYRLDWSCSHTHTHTHFCTQLQVGGCCRIFVFRLWPCGREDHPPPFLRLLMVTCVLFR